MTELRDDGRTQQEDPLTSHPDIPDHGRVLAVVCDPGAGIWQLLLRELDAFANRHPHHPVVTLDVTTTAVAAICDHHDLEVIPAWLDVADGKLEAARTGATSAASLSRFLFDS